MANAIHVLTLKADQIRGFLLASSASRKDDTREYLNAVHFNCERGYIEVTDGNIAIMHHAEFSRPIRNFLLPADELKRAAKLSTKRYPEIELLLDEDRAQTESLRTFTLRGYGSATIEFKELDNRFPDIGRLLPEKLSGKTAPFDGRLLGRLTEAFHLITDSSEHPTIHHNGASSPAIATTSTGVTLGVVMPIREPKAASEIRRDVLNVLAFFKTGKRKKAA